MTQDKEYAILDAVQGDWRVAVEPNACCYRGSLTTETHSHHYQLPRVLVLQHVHLLDFFGLFQHNVKAICTIYINHSIGTCTCTIYINHSIGTCTIYIAQQIQTWIWKPFNENYKCSSQILTKASPPWFWDTNYMSILHHGWSSITINNKCNISVSG